MSKASPPPRFHPFLFSLAALLLLWRAGLTLQLPAPAPGPAAPPGSAASTVVPPASPASAPREGELRGVWIHTYNPTDWDATMQAVAAAGFNCVFLRVARGVNAIYPSRYLPRDGWAETAGGDELLRAIEAAHRSGLQFHAWKVDFNSSAGTRAGPGPKAFYQQMAEQDRLARDPEGHQAPFLNPGDPRNTELEYNVFMELATRYPIDGIHFDYIRYTEEPSYDFDYGPISRHEFERATGQPVASWPADVFSGPRKLAYEDWERDNINRLVQRVHDAVKQANPRILVSAAVWRKHRLYRAALKQDWLHWVRQGWLDFVVPMDYTTDDEDFRQTVREQLPNTAGYVPLVAGIFNAQLKTPEALLRQIAIARQEGADGYVLFDYKPGMEAKMAALVRGPQSQSTYPAYRAPHVAWDLSGGLPRKDEAPAYLAGATAQVGFDVVTGPSWPPGAASAVAATSTVSMEARLERLDETPLQSLGELRVGAGDDRESPHFGRHPFLVPPGRSRLVLRGPVTTSDLRSWPFVVRGPVLDGLSAEAMAELRDRDLPPRPSGSGRRIAVYMGGMAATGLLKALHGQPGLDVYAIYHLAPAYWQTAQVLILPQLYDVADLTADGITNLRRWVEAGGALLLTHDAVGYRWHPRLFPEVAQGIRLSRQRSLQVEPNTRGLTTGSFEAAYPDHVVLEPAPGAQVLAREPATTPLAAPTIGASAGGPPAADSPLPPEARNAVVVAGQLGRGLVVLDGALPGYMPSGAMPAGEHRLLLELLRDRR